MPFNFKLPTAAFVAFEDYVTSDTHPSLASSATAARGVLRNVLKQYKRLNDSLKAVHLNDVLIALNEYIPYLLAIDAGLSNRPIDNEDISITLVQDVTVEWRAVLTSTQPGREPPRLKLPSLEYEVLFTLSTLASTYSLLARSTLHSLYSISGPTLSTEQRTASITSSMKHLLTSNSLYTYLAQRATSLSTPPPCVDVSPRTYTALAALCIAEATIISVLKDDPYSAAVNQQRNVNDNEWMYKAPTISPVRAALFARLCIAAADHASRGLGMLSNASGAQSKTTEALPAYLTDLRRAARGKACRFLGLDAELSGDTAKGIAWLRGAKSELGLSSTASIAGDNMAGQKVKSFGLSKLKHSIASKREDSRVSRGQGGDWGSDAGKFDEGRVVDELLAKWERENNVMNTQIVPPSGPLIAMMPSGREYFSNMQAWVPPNLDAGVLARMRAPPEERAKSGVGEDDSDDEDGGGMPRPPGAFESGGASTYY
jgi:hypothetical protein